jgi:hypothetical protein
VQLLEPILVPGFLVVRVEALREKPVDAVDGVGLRVGAHLEHFVVVRLSVIRHETNPS